jgi:hypothetical protein
MTTKEPDEVKDNIDRDLTTSKSLVLARKNEDAIKSTKSEWLLKLLKLYTFEEILQKLYNRTVYLEGELKESDAKLSQSQHENQRMRDILDGINRDKHKFEQDVEKEARSRVNNRIQAIWGGRPATGLALTLVLVIIIAFLSFIVLSSNPNVTNGLGSFEKSPGSQLTVVVIVLAIVIGFVAWLRYRKQ